MMILASWRDLQRSSLCLLIAAKRPEKSWAYLWLFETISQQSPNINIPPIFSHLQRDLEGEDRHEQVDHERQARDNQNSQLCEQEHC